MNQALINLLIVMGVIGLIIFLQGIENKKKEEAFKKKEKALRKKNKSRKKKKEEDKPWIVFPNLAMMLVYAIGIIYLISVFYGLVMFANIIGPFGLIFLFLWLVSMNNNKE